MKQLFNLGRRIERLLLIGIPIAFGSILFLLLAYASANQSNKAQIEFASQLRFAATLIRENAQALEKDYRQYESAKDKRLKGLYQDIYVSSLRMSTIFSSKRVLNDYPGNWLSYESIISKKLWVSSSKPPSQIAIDFIDEANEITSKKPPLAFGMELAEKAKLSILGAEITIPSAAYVTILQIFLAPVIILWLGSLYITRTREVMLIGESKELSEIFPHLINIYPMWQPSTLRKKSWIQYYAKYFAFAWFALLRCVSLAVFVVPIVGSYLFASSVLFDGSESFMMYVPSGLVGFVTLMVFLAELLPFHVTKKFNVDINRFLQVHD